MFYLERWDCGTTQEPTPERMKSCTEMTPENFNGWLAECHDRATYGCKVDVLTLTSFVFTTSNDTVTKFVLADNYTNVWN